MFVIMYRSLLYVHVSNFCTGMTTNERFVARNYGRRRNIQCGIHICTKFCREKGDYEEEFISMNQIPLLSYNSLYNLLKVDKEIFKINNH